MLQRVEVVGLAVYLLGGGLCAESRVGDQEHACLCGSHRNVFEGFQGEVWGVVAAQGLVKHLQKSAAADVEGLVGQHYGDTFEDLCGKYGQYADVLEACVHHDSGVEACGVEG